MKSRLFINGQKIDLKDDISIPLTFVNSDVKHATERKRSHSKTIVLPASKNNKSIFSSVWNLNYKTLDNSFGYDATGRVEAVLYSNDKKIFDGLFQLKKIVQLGDDYEIHGVLYSNILDIMDKVGQLSIAELGWSEYSHTLTESNILGSQSAVFFNGVSTSNYNSPFAGYSPCPQGWGYYYAIVDWALAGEERGVSHFTTSKNYPTWKHNEIPPLIYVKEVLYKIFTQAGYTFEIQSDCGGGAINGDPTGIGSGIKYDETGDPRTWTADGNLLERLMIGYEGGQIPNIPTAEITARLVTVTGSGTTANDIDFDIDGRPDISSTSYNANAEIYYVNYKLPFSNIQQNILQTSFIGSPTIVDSKNQLSQSSGKITIANTGNYKFEWSGNYDYTFTLTPYGGLNPESITPGRKISLLYGVFARGSFFQQRVVLDAITESTLTQTITFAVDIDRTFWLEQGDTVEIFMTLEGDLEWFEIQNNDRANSLVNWTLTPNTATSISMTCVDEVIQTNGNVELSNWCPKQSVQEFFKGFVRMFNLFIDEPDENNHVKIYDYCAYYKNQIDAIDWTNKLDKAKPIEIEPATNIEGKRYLYEWSHENDYLNDFYKNRMKTQYGSRTYVVKSTFQKGDKSYQLPFAQSVISNVEGGSSGTNKMRVPRIIESANSESLPRAYSGKPRLFFHINDESMLLGDWKIENTGNTLGSTLQDYPAAQHLWNVTPYKATTGRSFDLNFTIPQEIYFDLNSSYDASNLWNYHKKFIEELTDVDSKLMTANFRLNETDIADLDFGTLINIDGVVWKLNRIIDWRVDDRSSVKVELFKYLNIEQTVPDQTDPPPPTIPPLAS